MEEYANTAIQYYTGTSAPLQRIFTNEVDPIFLEGNARPPAEPSAFINEIRRHAANFYSGGVAEKEVACSIPRPLIQNLLAEQFMLHSEFTPCTPGVSPQASHSFFGNVLYSKAAKYSKRNEEYFFDVFSNSIPKVRADPKLRHSESNAHLPFTIPTRPLAPVNGSRLHTYFVVVFLQSLFQNFNFTKK